MAVSRKREYLADATGAQFTRNPMALASALEKLAAATAATRAITQGAAHLCIVDPSPGLLSPGRGSWPTRRVPSADPPADHPARGMGYQQAKRGVSRRSYLRRKRSRVERQRHHVIGAGRRRPRRPLPPRGPPAGTHDQPPATNPPSGCAPARAGAPSYHHQRHADPGRRRSGARPDACAALHLETGAAQQKRDDPGHVLVGQVQQRQSPRSAPAAPQVPRSRSTMRIARQ